MFINHISSYMPTRMPVRFQTRRRLFFGNLWGFGDIISDLQGQIDALNAQIADLEAQKAQEKGLLKKQKLTTQIAALKAKISPLQHKIDMIQDLVSKGYTIDEITAAMNAGKTTKLAITTWIKKQRKAAQTGGGAGGGGAGGGTGGEGGGGGAGGGGGGGEGGGTVVPAIDYNWLYAQGYTDSEINSAIAAGMTTTATIANWINLARLAAQQAQIQAQVVAYPSTSWSGGGGGGGFPGYPPEEEQLPTAVPQKAGVFDSLQSYIKKLFTSENLPILAIIGVGVIVASRKTAPARAGTRRRRVTRKRRR